MSEEYKTLNNDDLHGDKRTPKYNADSIFSRKSKHILQLNQYRHRTWL